MKALFKSLGFLQDISCDNNIELVINWPNVMLVVALVNLLATQSWVGAALFTIACVFTSYRWHLDPKPVRRHSKQELDQLAEEVRMLRDNLTSLKMKIGLEAPRFSAFQGKK